jgi:hypothetical protein
MPEPTPHFKRGDASSRSLLMNEPKQSTAQGLLNNYRGLRHRQPQPSPDEGHSSRRQ